jgi:predicted aspartyl protease
MLKVGQRFQTFNNEQDQNSKGIGLGLAICQEMINQMGPYKSFLLKSELKVGTMVSFLLSRSAEPCVSAAEIQQYLARFENNKLHK